MIRAVVVKDILWPQKQEDREEGGWKDKVNDVEDDEGRLVGDETTEENGEETGSTLSRVVSVLSQRSRRKKKQQAAKSNV